MWVYAPIAASATERTSGLTDGLCELTLETPEPPALAAFYSRVFDWDVLSREDDRIWLGCGPESAEVLSEAAPPVQAAAQRVERIASKVPGIKSSDPAA